MINPYRRIQKEQLPAPIRTFVLRLTEPGSDTDSIFGLNTTIAIDVDQGRYRR